MICSMSGFPKPLTVDDKNRHRCCRPISEVLRYAKREDYYVVVVDLLYDVHSLSKHRGTIPRPKACRVAG